MREIPRELLAGPFTVEHARRLGVSADVLRGRRFVAPFRGVRLPIALADDFEMRCRAAVLVLPPAAAFSHASALRLLRLPLPLGWKDRTLDVAVPRGLAVPDHVGIRGHDADWLPGDVVRYRGLRVVRDVRLVCDLATAGWEEVELLAVADAVLRRGRDLRDARRRLDRRVAQWAGRRGAARLRRVADLADAPVDSPMESRLRHLLVSAGIPRPCVNREVHDDQGLYVHTPDLSWPAYRVAVEYDGAHHFDPSPREGARRRRHDAARHEMMQEAGWLLRVLTDQDVLVHPVRAVDRTRSALRARGCPL